MRRAAVLALTLAAALAAAFFYAKNPMVDGAQRYAASVAAASGGVYLTLRSLNAFLSTAQEVEVGGQFVVSGTAHPLKALEPVDDTIERVAGMVFFVMVATGVLSVAMGPASAVGFAMLACALALVLVRMPAAAPLARQLGLYGAVLAVALPLSFLLSSALADRMTAKVLADHEVVLERITETVDAPLAQAASDDRWYDWFGGMRDDLGRYQRLAAALYAEADDLVSSLVGILGVFVFRLIVLPALILGALVVALRSLVRPR